jgi:hypothetical protein
MSVSFKCGVVWCGVVWVCCQVEISAADQSLVQSPTECVGVLENDQMQI